MKRLFTSLAAALVWTSAAVAAELIMVEQDGCFYCQKWDHEISHIYPKTDEGERAPLRRVNLRNLPDDIEFSSTPVFTPTFVLVENGKELGRIEGYPGDEFFWFLIGNLLNEHLGSEATQL